MIEKNIHEDWRKGTFCFLVIWHFKNHEIYVNPPKISKICYKQFLNQKKIM